MTQALHKACEEGSLLLVSLLLERGVDVNSKDTQGRTPLHIASATGDRLLAELLFQEGANLSSVSSCGEIPLDCSCDEDMTFLLVRMMAREGNGQLAKERLQLEALSDKIREKITRELESTSSRNKASPLSQLFAKRIVANLWETADRQLSSISNMSDCSRLSETESGFCEAEKSSHRSSLESVMTNMSVSSGFASVDGSSPHFNRRATTPLTKHELAAMNRSALRSRNRTASDSKKVMVKRALTWNSTRGKKSFPPLRQRVKKHVQFPADVLLDIAVRNDDFVETCNLIKSGKVDYNRVGCNSLTPLHRAAIDGSYKCLQLLIDLGANVNIQDEQGWRPLHDAVFHGHVRCAVALINAGADLNAETEDFRTVLDLAENDRMLRTVGRALIVKNCDEDTTEITSYFEDEVFEEVLNPDRETCV